mgnify:CR=1 FL=1
MREYLGGHILHKICRLYRDSKEDREDLFQEIVLQLWKAAPSFEGRSKFSTWMYRVVFNAALMRRRKLPYDAEAARKHLLQAEPVMRSLVERVGPYAIEVRGSTQHGFAWTVRETVDAHSMTIPWPGQWPGRWTISKEPSFMPAASYVKSTGTDW